MLNHSFKHVPSLSAAAVGVAQSGEFLHEVFRHVKLDIVLSEKRELKSASG